MAIKFEKIEAGMTLLDIHSTTLECIAAAHNALPELLDAAEAYIRLTQEGDAGMMERLQKMAMLAIEKQRVVNDYLAMQDKCDALRMRVDELEALFQQTHGVHADWVARGVALREAEEERDRLRAELDSAQDLLSRVADASRVADYGDLRWQDIDGQSLFGFGYEDSPERSAVEARANAHVAAAGLCPAHRRVRNDDR